MNIDTYMEEYTPFWNKVLTTHWNSEYKLSTYPYHSNLKLSQVKLPGSFRLIGEEK